MPEIETEVKQTRTEVAEYLRDLTDQLGGGGELKLKLDGRSVTGNPAEPLVLTLEWEWDPTDSEGKESIELESSGGPLPDRTTIRPQKFFGSLIASSNPFARIEVSM